MFVKLEDPSKRVSYILIKVFSELSKNNEWLKYFIKSLDIEERYEY